MKINILWMYLVPGNDYPLPPHAHPLLKNKLHLVFHKKTSNLQK